MTDPEELSWDIDGLRLTGLAWGDPGGVPVLALHGWLDHAGSFAELAPRLTGCRTVALDLSGQGHSAHRAAHAGYNIWEDLPQIAGLLDRLGWEDCVLLGHSRGAIIGTLFAAALPERVRALIALDCLAPEPHEGTVVDTLRGHVLTTRDQVARGPRRFASRADYIARSTRQGNAEPVAERLADRALAEDGTGVALRADPRLFARSAVKLTADQIDDVFCAIRCPVLALWGDAGLRARRPAMDAIARRAAGLIADYRERTIAGDHHFHLDPAGAQVAADRIADLLHGLNAP